MRTPAEHFEIADRLLAEVEHEGHPEDPYVRSMILRAQAHATLAQYGGTYNISVNNHRSATEGNN